MTSLLHLNQKNHQLGVTTEPQIEGSSYLSIKARVLIGIADIHGKACRSHQLSDAVVYQPVGVR